MPVTDDGGYAIRQTPRHEAPIARHPAQAAAQSAAKPVLSVRDLSALLGKSERSIHELRAAGLLPEPIQLGARSLRWFRHEVLSHLAEHAPRGGHAEPAQLARGRAAKKAGA